MDGCPLSIVVVNFNGGGQIEACLASAGRHGLPGQELFVVDNGSTDGSPETIAGRFRDVRLIRNRQNRGFAAANNQALSLARGGFLLLLNPDAEVGPDTFRLSLQAMERHPGCGVMGCRLEYPDGSLQPSCRAFPTLGNQLAELSGLTRLPRLGRLAGGYRMPGFGHDREREVDQVMGAYFLIRRQTFLQLGPLDERFFVYFEEVDYCLRARQAGWKVLFSPEPVARHAAGGISRGYVAERTIYFYRSLRRYFRKHHSAARAALLNPAIALDGTLHLAHAVATGHDPRPVARGYLAALRPAEWTGA